jgi:wobble nucleotide-excising tRNase
MITRIDKIEHRIFDGFSWPADLVEFGRFNLIYGWNGSGKTTLSNLFRYLEKKQSLTEGKVEFQIDGTACAGATLATSHIVPQVRVFNQDYREDSVFATTQQLKPIFYLGRDSVEKQKQIGGLNKAKTEEQKKLDAITAAKTKAIKALDDFCISEGKTIRELLSSSGDNRYNNYDKAYFKGACIRIGKLNPWPAGLTKEEKELLKKQILETPKDVIEAITLAEVDFDALREKIKNLLQRTVVSQVIEEMSNDASLADWVRQGVVLHTGEKHTDNCRFCNSALPAGRIAKLQAHFNDEYNRFSIEIDSTRTEVAQGKQNLAAPQLPAKTAFYDHLSAEYVKVADRFSVFVKSADAYLGKLSDALATKKSKPFEGIALNPLLEKTAFPESGAEALKAVSDIIDRHNTETTNFANVISDARSRLEESLVLEALPDFKNRTQAIEDLEKDVVRLSASIRELGRKVAALESEIIEHVRPAEELTNELRSYLGRDELKFEAIGNAYRITRNGIIANNLSEGERTAIALLYFLKSLRDKGFSLNTDIVVIDDPVSSLDANSLFCAFGYVKEKTKEAGQLFILTHNFALFRQIKNWFNHLPHQSRKDVTQRPARFYMVEARSSGGKRKAAIKLLDRLLHQYESEYHYLFNRVHEEASSTVRKEFLEDFYAMPNIARRVLESFLSFRYPALAGKLEQQLEGVTFDAAKKGRILRFLHTYSHDGKISEPEHDLSILAETPEILKDLIELLRAEDPKHCQEMEKLLMASHQGTG